MKSELINTTQVWDKEKIWVPNIIKKSESLTRAHATRPFIFGIFGGYCVCMCRALIADSLKCTGISCVAQVSELKGQLNQVARSGSSTSNNILMRSAMMSPSTAASQYDEKHRSVLKKIEKDRKEAHEVRKRLPGHSEKNPCQAMHMKKLGQNVTSIVKFSS